MNNLYVWHTFKSKEVDQYFFGHSHNTLPQHLNCTYPNILIVKSHHIGFILNTHSDIFF